MNETPPLVVEDEAVEASSSVPSFRRVWNKRNPHHGSSLLALKAMAVLYDAEGPLTRDELANRLLAQLVPTEQSYLEAWHLRQQAKQRSWDSHRETKTMVRKPARTMGQPSLLHSVRRWLSDVFFQRCRHGQTLVRDATGRYRPGPVAPRVLTMEGQLVRFTPAMRHELEQTDHDQGRAHLALLEWERLIATLDLRTVEARAHLLILLARRLLIGPGKRLPLDERKIFFTSLLRLADTPAVQRAVLQRALDALWPATSETPEVKP